MTWTEMWKQQLYLELELGAKWEAGEPLPASLPSRTEKVRNPEHSRRKAA
ncbi:MAG: hypothetical protein WBE38_04480 [Terracidiphilus sp.]|jgi:hypothetical protein